MPRCGAEFRETKTHRGPRGQGFGILVHSSGEPDGIGKAQTELVHRQCRRAKKRLHRIQREIKPAHASERVQRAMVNGFGWLTEQQRPNGIAIQPVHERIVLLKNAEQGNLKPGENQSDSESVRIENI